MVFRLLVSDSEVDTVGIDYICYSVSCFTLVTSFVIIVVISDCFDAVGWASGRASGL